MKDISYDIQIFLYLFFQISSAQTDQKMSEICSSSIGFDVLDSIGYPGDPGKITLDEKEKILEYVITFRCILDHLSSGFSNKELSE